MLEVSDTVKEGMKSEVEEKSAFKDGKERLGQLNGPQRTKRKRRISGPGKWEGLNCRGILLYCTGQQSALIIYINWVDICE